MIVANTKKFGEQTVGIHGGELPKFKEDSTSKTWWKHQEGRVEDPKVQSMAVLRQNQKYWANNDLTLLADKTHEEAP